MTLSHFTKLITTHIKVTWQLHLNYRLGALIWILRGFFLSIVLIGVWITVAKTRSLEFNQDQIITYFLVNMIVIRLTQSWAVYDLQGTIKRGTFSTRLIKPYPYFITFLSNDISLKAIRLITLIPFCILIAVLYKANLILSLSPFHLISFTISSVSGYIIILLLSNLIGLSSLWLSDGMGISNLFGYLRDFLNGSLFPLIFLPIAAQSIISYLPFWYTLGFPTQIIMGTLSTQQIIHGNLVSLFWILILATFSFIVFHRGIKQYEAIGI